MDINEAIKTIQAHTANCAQSATRCIVVLDKGFIFVGDLSHDTESGMYTLTSVKNVRKWAKGGFGGLTKSAKESGAVLDVCEPIKFHGKAMVFAAPVGGDWDA